MPQPPRAGAMIRRLALVAAPVAALAGCSDDPGAALFSLPETPRQAVAVAPTTPDGYPNVNYTPAASNRDPLPAATVAATERELAADLAGQEAKPPPPVPTASSATLAAVGATHVQDARASIDAAAAQ